jgi:nucleoside phosphorylase
VLLVVAATEAELGGAGAAERLVCGIGPLEAAAATARALAERRPDAVLNVGIAGAQSGRGLEPTELVIGSEAVYCDAASSLVSSRVAADARLLAAAIRAWPHAQVLPIGTSARVGGTTGVDVEAMEGFGVLRAAELAGVPALELRAISNAIDEPDRSRWLFAEALDALAAALPRAIAELARE